MHELLKDIHQLKKTVEKTYSILKIDEYVEKLEKLRGLSQKENFWNNNEDSVDILKEITVLDNFTKPWVSISNKILDLEELAKLNDVNLKSELIQNYEELNSSYNLIKEDLKFIGEYDKNNVIFSIFAGAGGTDAQDWANILLRMYLKFFEKKLYKVQYVSENTGEEAGIKSVSLIVEGDKVYGNLKSENGVHRLVRLSPFNADHLRQTSFARVEVIPQILNSKDLEINNSDLEIDVFRSGGNGGQSVNTTDSAVRITHVPSGITVSIQNERSQLQNKEIAMQILKSKLLKLKREQEVEELSKIKGPLQSAEWGNQIRSYVMHPYKQVKDLRTKFETSSIEDVLDGNIQSFIDKYLDQNLSSLDSD